MFSDVENVIAGTDDEVGKTGWYPEGVRESMRAAARRGENADRAAARRDGSSCFFITRFFSSSWLKDGASRSTGEPGYDLVPGPVIDDNEVSDDSDDVDARLDSVTPANSSAEDPRGGCDGLCQRQFQDLPSDPHVSGWLYIHVATRTTEDPRMNVSVIWKLNRATEARNEMTMLREVAKPFRMLSAYLMTNAVNSPPRTPCTLR